MDDDVARVQSLVRNLGIPRILRKVTCKKQLKATRVHLFFINFKEDKQ